MSKYVYRLYHCYHCKRDNLINNEDGAWYNGVFLCNNCLVEAMKQDDIIEEKKIETNGKNMYLCLCQTMIEDEKLFCKNCYGYYKNYLSGSKQQSYYNKAVKNRKVQLKKKVEMEIISQSKMDAILKNEYSKEKKKEDAFIIVMFIVTGIIILTLAVLGALFSR